MDLLNIFACIGVLILHTNSVTVHQFDGKVNCDFIWGLLTHSLFYWPVPVFLMLSGSNIIGYAGGVNKFIQGRTRRTLLPFVAWSIMYAVLYNVNHPIHIFSASTLHSAANGLLGLGYMWFFIPLFAFYLSAPFLSLIMQNASANERRTFLVLGFVFASIIPFISSITGVGIFRYNLFPMTGSFLIYPVLGWMICNDKWFDEHHKAIYTAAIICAIVHFAGLYTTIVSLGLESKVFQNTLFPTDFIISTAVFLFFKRQNWNKLVSTLRLTPERIVAISSCSLGVYLIQNFLFVVSSYGFNILNNHYFGFIATYIVGVICVAIMKRIPLVKNIVP